MHAIYLENDSVNLLGYKIYGSPNTILYGNVSAFMKERDHLK
jgi:hypothetical protein